jgi:hypothetical protein
MSHPHPHPLSRELLTRLLGAPPETSVSLYLPTHRRGPDRRQDPIRFDNLLRQARAELEATGWRDRDITDLLAPAADLLDDQAFWTNLDHGLAVFVRQQDLVTCRLPEEVDEIVAVADRFHVTPLVPLLAPDGLFFVLTVTQTEVGLLRASRYQVSVVELGETSRRAAALSHDDRERQLNLHGASRVGRGQVTAAFHGHADDVDLADADLRRFFRIIDDAVNQIIGAPPAPLVLAGASHEVAAYRRASRHPDIVESEIDMNPTGLELTELRERAWPLVAPRFEQARRRAEQAIATRAGPIAVDVPGIVTAAGQGRVESLFVAAGEHRWGVVAPEPGSVSEHDVRRAGDRDLVDVAVTDTLIHDGDVFVVDRIEVPLGAPLAAVLRF